MMKAMHTPNSLAHHDVLQTTTDRPRSRQMQHAARAKIDVLHHAEAISAHRALNPGAD
jgi:hypothetical protein